MIQCGLYALWSIGAFILFRIGDYVDHSFQLWIASTFRVYPFLGLRLLLYMILGIYIGILFVRQWKLALNIPLLVFVFIPMLFMNPIVHGYFLHTKFLFNSLDMHEILGVVSGCVLMVGLFGSKGKYSDL